MAKSLTKQLERRRRMAEAKADARGLVLDQYEDFLTKADITILYTLHKNFGFGKKRAERFYLNLVLNQYKMIEQFRTAKDDDETHYWMMEEDLKKAGIDVKALQKKVEKIKEPVPYYEEQNKIIEEWKKEHGITL